jgi:hypothetical protein
MIRIVFLSLASACLLFPFAGCGSQFKDQKEELAYLESLSNTTPSQWKRREELRKQKKTWPPELHSTVALPEGAIVDIYATLESFRQASAMLKAQTYRDVVASEKAGHAIYTPEFEAADELRITTLWPGSKVQIMEIGSDYVHIDALSDASGETIKPVSRFKGPLGQQHGYIKKWWESK